MQIILLERVENLGQMGDVVKVKAGYARNFLLPRNKALRATNQNVAMFEAQKKVLLADNLKKREEAEQVAKKADGVTVVLVRQASEAGQLYGSVSAADIADVVTQKGFKISKSQVSMERAYKVLGLFPVKVSLHPEVTVTVTINIARSLEEAKIQEQRGEALIVKTDAEERLAEAAVKRVEAEEAAAKKAAAAAATAEAAPAAEETAA
jgi:large subunit ribosomal protein L9